MKAQYNLPKIIKITLIIIIIIMIMTSLYSTKICYQHTYIDIHVFQYFFPIFTDVKSNICT